jgi:predicted transcriptional regulator
MKLLKVALVDSFKETKLSSIETRILHEILFLKIKSHEDPTFNALNERLSPLFHKEFQEGFKNLEKKMLIECYNNSHEIKVKITPLGLSLVRQLIESDLKRLIE